MKLDKLRGRIIEDPQPEELRMKRIAIQLQGDRWSGGSNSGSGYVQIIWWDGHPDNEKKVEVRAGALLRGTIRNHTGDALPDNVAMRACALAIHDNYREMLQKNIECYVMRPTQPPWRSNEVDQD